MKMALANLRSEERIGLGVAAAAHIALGIALALQPARGDNFPIPERMVVSLAENVALTSTAPNPSAEDAQAAVAPTLSDEPASISEPAPATIAPPIERPAVRPAPVRRQAARPRPAPRATAQPRPRATSQPKPTPRETSGASRIGTDFLPGSGTAARRNNGGLPASQIGASAKASLVSAISRQIIPHWQGKAPQGVDAEKLVTVLSFSLNVDGSLKGRPKIRRQTGITDGNRLQAGRHGELAVRAVQLAAPFDLPSQYYQAWKRASFRFDKDLSQ